MYFVVQDSGFKVSHGIQRHVQLSVPVRSPIFTFQFRYVVTSLLHLLIGAVCAMDTHASLSLFRHRQPCCFCSRPFGVGTDFQLQFGPLFRHCKCMVESFHRSPWVFWKSHPSAFSKRSVLCFTCFYNLWHNPSAGHAHPF